MRLRGPIGKDAVGRAPAVSTAIAWAICIPPYPPRPTLRRLSGPPVTVERDGRSNPDEAALLGARGDELEDGPIERIDPGGRQPDPPEAEREHRVLGVAGVGAGRPVGREDRTVRLAVERLVEGRQEAGQVLRRGPGVLEPAGAHFGVCAAVDP